MALTPHPLLVPWSKKNGAISLLPLWAVRPVQSLSACTRVHFTLPYFTFWSAGTHYVSRDLFKPPEQLTVKRYCRICVLTALTMQSYIIWRVTPFSMLYSYRRFGRSCCLRYRLLRCTKQQNPPTHRYNSTRLCDVTSQKRVAILLHRECNITFLLICSMVQSPSWEANWFAVSQEIPRISRNPKVHFRTHKRPPPVSILGQPNLVHTPTSQLLEIHPNIIHPCTPRSPHWSLSLRFPHQDPIHPPLLTHTRHMPSPSHSSRFDHPQNIG